MNHPARRVLLEGLGLRILTREGTTPLGLVFLGFGALGVVAVGLLGLDRIPLTLCGFKAMTGLPCPTCGSTRVLGRVAASDLLGALAMNPLAAVIGVVVVLWGLGELLLLRRHEVLVLEASPRASRVLWVGAGSAVLANWVWLVASGR
jgi:hypothetical protein